MSTSLDVWPAHRSRSANGQRSKAEASDMSEDLKGHNVRLELQLKVEMGKAFQTAEPLAVRTWASSRVFEQIYTRLNCTSFSGINALCGHERHQLSTEETSLHLLGFLKVRRLVFCNGDGLDTQTSVFDPRLLP